MSTASYTKFSEPKLDKNNATELSMAVLENKQIVLGQQNEAPALQILLVPQPEMTIKDAVNYKSFPLSALKEIIILLVNPNSQMHV